MEFLPKEIEAYIEANTSQESKLLHQLNRETYQRVLTPRMLSGHLQGRALSMMSHMIKPKCILEIGTYTGYSAICLAEGLQPGGQLITIDINEELEDMARAYFSKAGMTACIDFKIGNAIDIIPSLKTPYDLVFIDADKTNYSNYFDLIIDQVVSGGYIIADNVLWSGKVLEEISENDVDTKSIIQYNEKIQLDPRVENVLFPIRDGLMIARKI